MKDTFVSILNMVLMALMIGLIMHAQVGACRLEASVVFFAMMFNCITAIIKDFRHMA